MAEPIKILLQTTIPPTADDWHIGRFGLLRDYLASLQGSDGAPLTVVEARDRAPPGQPDPVLSKLDESDYDELWLFAVDTGDGLTQEDCAGISRFRKRGGGMLVTRDHHDLGSSVCNLGGVGAAHYFHSKNPDPDPSHHANDDADNPDIQWPNYHSGANGDYQEIQVAGVRHVLLSDPTSPDGMLRYLPAHPHEGAVGAPPGDSTARVIATGHSSVTGREFNLVVAFEPSAAGGPAVAESTFHHFVDYNWDIEAGAPSFVTDRPGNKLAELPKALEDTRQYVRNLALWLGGRPVATSTQSHAGR
ncbi:MAG TPA: hypothetical protein VGO18_39135 [Steroidobacteraceae bacterium]|jgi:hypothetical protein|nr:hypothetical protein [Steroidobacteraceae bacterium]